MTPRTRIVRITRIATNGHRRILAFMVAEDLFGVPDCGTYANSSETVYATRAYRIPWQKLRQAMSREPQLQLNLLIKLAHDFRQAQRQMMMLGLQSAHQRVALFLLEFMRNPGFFDEARSLLSLPVNHFDLADYLGTTPEAATLALARLEKERLLKRVNAHTLQILSLKGLQMLQYGPPAGAKRWSKSCVAAGCDSYHSAAALTDSNFFPRVGEVGLDFTTSGGAPESHRTRRPSELPS